MWEPNEPANWILKLSEQTMSDQGKGFSQGSLKEWSRRELMHFKNRFASKWKKRGAEQSTLRLLYLITDQINQISSPGTDEKKNYSNWFPCS